MRFGGWGLEKDRDVDFCFWEVERRGFLRVCIAGVGGVGGLCIFLQRFIWMGGFGYLRCLGGVEL